MQRGGLLRGLDADGLDQIASAAAVLLERAVAPAERWRTRPSRAGARPRRAGPRPASGGPCAARHRADRAPHAHRPGRRAPHGGCRSGRRATAGTNPHTGPRGVARRARERLLAPAPQPGAAHRRGPGPPRPSARRCRNRRCRKAQARGDTPARSRRSPLDGARRGSGTGRPRGNDARPPGPGRARTPREERPRARIRVRRAGNAPREPPSAVPRPLPPPGGRREPGQNHLKPGIPALRSARTASRGHGRCVGVGAALACVVETLLKRPQPVQLFTLVLHGSTIAPPWWSRPPGRLRASGSAFVAACPSSGLATAWKIVFPVVKPGSSSPAWLIVAGIRSAGGLWRRLCGGTIRRPRTTSGCARCYRA